MIHEILPVGWLRCNCSVFGDQEGGEAIVIDPGDEIERILAVLRRHRLKLTLIAITHAHIDHIGGARKLKQATGAPVYMHEADLWLAQALPQQAQMIGLPESEAPEALDAPDALLRGRATRYASGRLPAASFTAPVTRRAVSACTFPTLAAARSCSPATPCFKAASDERICPAATPTKSCVRSKPNCWRWTTTPWWCRVTAR